MEFGLIYLGLCVAVAVLASRRGRSGLGWFIVSLLLSPVLGFVFVLVLRDLAHASNEPTPDTHVRCPDCKELVRRDASKCKHCGCKLVPQ